MARLIDTMSEQMEVVGKFGVPFLDDYLLGLKKQDYILIGATSGAGKTQLAYQIAFSNAEKANVHLFALEAYQNEPFVRKAFIEYSAWLKREHGRYADYVDFLQGKVVYMDKLFQIEDELAKKYYKLRVHYGEEGFSPEMLMVKLEEIAAKDNCDMIIIDHLDFFDLHPDQSENTQITDILKLLLRINLKWKIPVVVVSHVRKPFNRKCKVPSKEDLFGTSNKHKIPKTVILFAPDFDNNSPERDTYSTLISIPKDRIRGATHLVAQCAFSGGSREYADRYNLVFSRDHYESFEPVPADKLPRWAVHARPVTQEQPSMQVSVSKRFSVRESHD